MPFFSKNHFLLTLLEKRPPIVLVPIWILVQLSLYYWYGIRIVYDSYRYLSYAEALVNGTDAWYIHSAKFYAAYTFLLTLILHLVQLPIAAVILFQTVVSGFAAVFLYRSTFIVSKSKKVAALATLLFICWPDLQFWNLYIHTESLYISLSVFIMYFVLTARRPADYIMLAILLIGGTFLRPNGLFLVLAVIAAYLTEFKFKPYLSSKYSTVILGSLLLATLLIVAAFFLEVFSPIQYYETGQFIQGYTAYTLPLEISFAKTQLVIFNLLNIIFIQPLDFLKLLTGRFLFFWTQVRPYYSITHNVVILIFFLPLYYFTRIAFFKTKNQPLLIFILALMFLHTLMVTIIAVDWDNRFIAPLLPSIFMLAAIGFFYKIKE